MKKPKKRKNLVHVEIDRFDSYLLGILLGHEDLVDICVFKTLGGLFFVRRKFAGWLYAGVEILREM